MLRHLLFLSFAAGLAVACAPSDDDLDPTTAGEPTEAAEQEVVGAGRRVCSWNMRRLGNQFDQLPKDLKSASQIIKDNCDLVAVEEDMATSLTSGGSGNTGYDDLQKALGARYWGGLATSKPAPLPQTSNSEHYAFFFRKSAVSICENWGTEARRLPDPEDIYLREPAFGCFKFKSSEHELVLAGYHAIFGEPAERKREVGFLDDDNDNDGTKDDLFELMKASRPAGSDPDVVLVGDFNLNINEIREVLPRYVDHTIGNGSTLNGQDGIANQYDHVVVMQGARMLEAGTKPAEVLDVRTQKQPGVSFYRTVSDHLPIRFVMK